MDDWCKKTHGESGLTQKVLLSETSSVEAETRFLKFLQKNVEYKKGIVCGNSVHMDMRFIQKEMPRIADHLHYRIIDVSTIKELCRRWAPDVFERCPKKLNNHRALDDILESIEEMRFYRQNFLACRQ